MNTSKVPPIGPPETPLERRRKKRRKNNIIILSVVGFLVLSIGSYKGYFQEYFAYREAVTASYLADADIYTYRYPNGRWKEEVEEHCEELAFEDAKSEYENLQRADVWDSYMERFSSGAHYSEARKLFEEGSYNDLVLNINSWFDGVYSNESPLILIENFNEDFKESAYLPQVDSMYGVVWGRLNDLFADVVRKKYDRTGGIKFFKTAMKYLEENKMTKIYVHFSDWDVRLKDWDDYSSKAKKYLDELTEFSNSYSASSFQLFNSVKSPPPTENPPPSARKYVQGNYRSSNKSAFVRKLKNNFIEIFGNAPFDIIQASDGANTEDHVSFHVDSKISNQEFKEGGSAVPELYTITTSTNFLDKKFDGYIFGIESQCAVTGTIPGNAKDYKGTFKGDPASSFSDINGITDAYEKLIGSIFESMGESLGNQLGFPSGS